MTGAFDDQVERRRAHYAAQEAARQRAADAAAMTAASSAERARQSAERVLPGVHEAAVALQLRGRSALKRLVTIQPAYEHRRDSPGFPVGMEFRRDALGRNRVGVFQPGWVVGLRIRVPLEGAPMVHIPNDRGAFDRPKLISVEELAAAGIYAAHRRSRPPYEIAAPAVFTEFVGLIADYLARLAAVDSP